MKGEWLLKVARFIAFALNDGRERVDGRGCLSLRWGEMWYKRAIRESPLRWGKAKMGAEEMVCSGKGVQEYEKNLKKFEIDTVSACHFMYFILKYIRLERNSLTIQ